MKGRKLKSQHKRETKVPTLHYSQKAEIYCRRVEVIPYQIRLRLE